MTSESHDPPRRDLTNEEWEAEKARVERMQEEVWARQVRLTHILDQAAASTAEFKREQQDDTDA